MQIKNKQQKVASITLSLFIGSWLLLLCQTCFAVNDDTNSQSMSATEVSNPCHTPDNNVLEKSNSVDDEHCLGACDCDAITITTSPDKKSELKENTNYSPDLFAYVLADVSIFSRAPPNHRILVTPERATLLPFQTYNVLLI